MRLRTAQGPGPSESPVPRARAPGRGSSQTLPPPAPAQGGRAGPTFTRGIKFFALTHAHAALFSREFYFLSSCFSQVWARAGARWASPPDWATSDAHAKFLQPPLPTRPRSLVTLSQLMSLTALWPPCGPARLCWARSRSPSQSDLPAPTGDRRMRLGPGRGPSSSPYLHRPVG